jgi:uridine kinase
VEPLVNKCADNIGHTVDVSVLGILLERSFSNEISIGSSNAWSFTLPGAATSSLANDIATWLSQHGTPVLRATLDDFKRPWREAHLYDRTSPAGYYRNAYDYDAVRELLLEPFATASPAGCALCSIDPLTQIDHQGERTPVPSNSALVADGVFAFRPEIDHWWDVRIWLHITPEEAIRRCTERDRSWAGTEAERLVRERFLPSEQLYEAEVAPRTRADVVVDNTDIEAPELIR